MTNLLILIVTSTVITSIINALKPAYKKFTGKYTVTVNVVLAFVLWILSAFSLSPLFPIELNTGLIIMIGLALGTGSNVWYDIWSLIEKAGYKLEQSAEAIRAKLEKEGKEGEE